MTISAVKYNRAMSKSAVGRYPASASAMLERVPEGVALALTSTQLAAMLDAMWGACQEAKGIAARDAIAEGAIWDARSQRLREIA
jgi:hypothetical protein